MKKLITWVEIPAENMERAVKFYNTLLRLDLKILDFGEEKMACFPNDEGAISLAPGFKPGKEGVLVSLNMENRLDEVLATTEEHGASIIRPKTKIEADGRGFFALVIDTEGNKIGLYGDK